MFWLSQADCEFWKLLISLTLCVVYTVHSTRSRPLITAYIPPCNSYWNFKFMYQHLGIIGIRQGYQGGTSGGGRETEPTLPSLASSWDDAGPGLSPAAASGARAASYLQPKPEEVLFWCFLWNVMASRIQKAVQEWNGHTVVWFLFLSLVHNPMELWSFYLLNVMVSDALSLWL